MFLLGRQEKGFEKSLNGMGRSLTRLTTENMAISLQIKQMPCMSSSVWSK